jgi:hypothetical protein
MLIALPLIDSIVARCTRALLLVMLFASHGGAIAQSRAIAKSEVDTLRAAAVTLAQSALRSYGEFAPYGAGLLPSREVIVLGETDGRARHGDSLFALRTRLSDALRSGEVKATAFVYEVKVNSPASDRPYDAIAVALEHRDGYAALYVIPYKLGEGTVTLGESQIVEPRTIRRVN